MELSRWIGSAEASDDPRLVWYALTWQLDYQTMVQWCYVRAFADGGESGTPGPVQREVPLGAWLYLAAAQLAGGQAIPRDIGGVLVEALRANPGLALWSRLTPVAQRGRMRVDFQLQPLREPEPDEVTA